MAEPEAVATTEPETAAAPAAPRSKLVKRLEIGGLLGGIIAVQCVLAYLYLPSAEAPAATAEAAHDEKAHAETPIPEPVAHEDPHAEHQEVDLGQFSLTSFDPTSNTTLLIDFHLFGTVLADHGDAGGEGADKGGHGGHGGHGAKGEAADPLAGTKFGKLYKKNKHRIRDQVITIIRNAEMTDLADPGLGLIKRQILAKTNALMGEPLLKEVIFSDFAVVEQ